MLKNLITRLYRSLPLVREILDIRTALWRVERIGLDLQTSQIIRLLDFDLRDHPRYGDPLRLHRFQTRVCSQNGEDGIIHEIFRRIGTTNRIFAEVGVGDGCENNTAFLLSQGWTGSWIDGDDGFLTTLASRSDLPKDCLKHHVGFATRENIAQLFAQLGVPKEFDLLSLDIDQNTYYIWEGLRDFRPRVIVVEYNGAVPPDVDWKVQYGPDRAWNGTQNFGASLKAYELLGRQLGYSLVGCDFIGLNAFFVRDDLLADKFAKPFTSENHHEPPRYTMIHKRFHPASILERPGRG